MADERPVPPRPSAPGIPQVPNPAAPAVPAGAPRPSVPAAAPKPAAPLPPAPKPAAPAVPAGAPRPSVPAAPASAPKPATPSAPASPAPKPAVPAARASAPAAPATPAAAAAETPGADPSQPVSHAKAHGAASHQSPPDINDLLRVVVEAGCSDLHVACAPNPTSMRSDGQVRSVEIDGRKLILSGEQARQMVYDILSGDQRKELEERQQIDFAYQLPSVARFRGNAYFAQGGLQAAFRVIPEKILTLEELDMPDVLKALCEMPNGLVLVTGPTGSGKSTTLAAMIDYINRTRHDHILTIEDPIEFVHKPRKCLISQRQLGDDFATFADALKASLRQDPDVILVGELRDPETISLGLTAAETGHLVFGTLHTNSAVKTADRIIDAFPANQQAQVRAMLAGTLQGIVAQQLLRRRDGGRVAALEILRGTPAVRNLIREEKIHMLPSQLETSRQIGMQSMRMALADLVASGAITREEALRSAGDEEEFNKLTRARIADHRTP